MLDRILKSGWFDWVEDEDASVAVILLLVLLVGVSLCTVLYWRA